MAGEPRTRVLMTGASGFVGRWIIERLRAEMPQGSTVDAITFDFAPAGVDATCNVDIRDRAAIKKLIADTRPTAVLHLAAIASPPMARSDPRLAWDVNFAGTQNLAEAVMAEAPEARFVFIGTSESYGATFRASTGPLDESAVLDPVSVYAATKAAADLMIGQMARDGLRAVRFRPFNHTGPGQTELFVVPAFAAQIARIEAGKQEPVMRVGNLEAIRDFSDVRDIVEAYARAVIGPWNFANGTIFNLASGAPRKIGDILSALVGMSKVAVRIEQDPARLRPDDTPLAIGDFSRAREVLGWAPKRDFTQTLRDVLDFARAKS